MNKNHENYKNTYSQFRPSDESIERVMNMTQKNKQRSGVPFKRIAAAVLVLVLLIGGGFGTNYAIQRNIAKNELFVLVAYASAGDFMKVGSTNEQELFYGLYPAPKNDNDASEKAKDRWRQDYETVKSEFDKLGEKGYYASLSGGTGGYDCYNEAGEETATLFIVRAGEFALNLDDYTDVKSFRIENSSEYGYLLFENLALYEKLEEIAENDDYSENNELTDEETLELYGQGHKFEITGDELRRSKDSGMFSGGTEKHEVNKGYFLSWEPSMELLNDAIGNNPYFDLSQIKDTITFTVEFNDSTVKTASLNLYFDSDGYMHFEG